MFVLNRVKEAKRLKKQRLSASDREAWDKMCLVAWYMLKECSYNSTAIFETLSEMSEDYYRGAPTEYKQSCINSIIESAKKEAEKEIAPCPVIIVYKEELDIIKSLNQESLERLAFAFLIYVKTTGRVWNYENNSAVFSLMGNSKSLSGESRTTAIYKLGEANIVKFWSKPNKRYRYNKTLKPISLMFKVLIIPEKPEKCTEAFKITNPDRETIYLWYLQYRGNKTTSVNTDKGRITYPISNCAACGCPILKKSNRQRFCADCAADAKQENNKKYIQ